MRKIAIIIPSLNNGGAERTAANLSNSLKDEFDVHLIVFDGKNIAYPFSGKLHDLCLSPRKSLVGKILNVFLRVIKVSKIKKQERFDVVLSLMDGPNMVNVLSKKNEIVITSVRNQLSKLFPQKGMKALYLKAHVRFCSFFSKKIVTLSKGVEENLIDSYSIPPHKIKTIYNPCNVDLLLEKSSDELLREFPIDSHTVTTMGRMSIQKGQWMLIRSFRKVVDRIADAKLIVLGSGSLENELKQIVKRHNLENNVFFAGFVESPHRMIKASRVFVFPSLFEGLGNVLIEAMGCGTPCISTDCLSGPREIIAPNTKYVGILNEPEYAQYGILVRAHEIPKVEDDDCFNETEEQLAKSIVDVLENDDLWRKYHEQSLLRAQDFSYERIKEDWLSLIDSCLKK